MVIHYCGDKVFGMLPGWPVCGSGDFAFATRAKGNQTTIEKNVTCKKCIKKLNKAINVKN